MSDRETLLGEVRQLVESVLPAECYVTRSDWMRCTAMIGGGSGAAKWTEDMCCLPCRVRSALASDDLDNLLARRDRQVRAGVVREILRARAEIEAGRACGAEEVGA